jgi:hypothetical protein
MSILSAADAFRSWVEIVVKCPENQDLRYVRFLCKLWDENKDIRNPYINAVIKSCKLYLTQNSSELKFPDFIKNSLKIQNCNSKQFLIESDKLNIPRMILTGGDKEQLNFYIKISKACEAATKRFEITNRSANVFMYDKWLIESMDFSMKCDWCLTRIYSLYEFEQCLCVQCDCFYARTANTSKSYKPRCYYCVNDIEAEKKISQCYGCSRKYICEFPGFFEKNLCGYCEDRQTPNGKLVTRYLSINKLNIENLHFLYQSVGLNVTPGVVLRGSISNCLKYCVPKVPLQITPMILDESEMKLYEKLRNFINDTKDSKTCLICENSADYYYMCETCNVEICMDCCKKHYEITMGEIVLPGKIKCPSCASPQSWNGELKPLFKGLKLPEVWDPKLYYFACYLCQAVVPHSNQNCHIEIPNISRSLCSSHVTLTERKFIICPGVYSDEQKSTCGIVLQRNGGCQHLTCPCGNHICDTCEKSFTSAADCYTHINSVHGGIQSLDEDSDELTQKIDEIFKTPENVCGCCNCGSCCHTCDYEEVSMRLKEHIGQLSITSDMRHPDRTEKLRSSLRKTDG